MLINNNLIFIYNLFNNKQILIIETIILNKMNGIILYNIRLNKRKNSYKNKYKYFKTL